MNDPALDLGARDRSFLDKGLGREYDVVTKVTT